MNIVLCSTGGKSEQFWRIETSGTVLMVNYGKCGSAGKTDLKEFETAQLCEKQAEKLLLAKQKKGYAETSDFDAASHIYYDVPDFGAHSLTSHPTFRKYFSDGIYYDCADEYAPFGNDTGSDVLWTLEEITRKRPAHTARFFITNLVTEEWGMPYIPPMPGISDARLRVQADEFFGGLFGRDIMLVTDQAIIAAVLGMIKIKGHVMKSLADTALYALDRMEALERLYPEYAEESVMPYTQRMRQDLQAYLADTYHGNYYGYIGEISAKDTAALQARIARAGELFRITDLSDGKRMAEEIHAAAEEILHTGSYPSGYENLTQAVFALSLLFGQALCNGYGWRWKLLGEEGDCAFGVVSPQGQYSHIPRLLFERILVQQNHYGADGENDNTIRLLYNMLDGIDSRPAPERYFPIL